MNEKIRELADQILPNEREFNKGDPKDWGYFFSGEELEKFAELILVEVTDILSTYRGKMVFIDGAEYNYEHPIIAIKKYFGVKD